MSAAGMPIRLASSAAVLLLAAGCAGFPDHLVNRLDLGPRPPNPPPNALMCASTQDTTAQDDIGAPGGTLNLPNGHTLRVRPNTVSGPVRFHMTERAADYILVKFGPGNRPFNPPVEVTLSSAACGADQPSGLRVFRWHNPAQGWEEVQVDSVARLANGRGMTATFRATGFTSFSLVAP